MRPQPIKTANKTNGNNVQTLKLRTQHTKGTRGKGIEVQF